MTSCIAKHRLSTLSRHFTSTRRKYNWAEHQKLLPRLPLPSLELSLERYLESVKPLQTVNHHKKTISVVKSFLKGDGVILHSELSERNHQASIANLNTSYVRPFWNDMYLKGRYPVPINSNPYLIFPPDKIHQTQASRAANVVCGFAQFWLAKMEDRLPPDVNGGHPNCMDEYDRLFSSARIPHKDRDYWKETPESKHIVVLRGENIYKVDVITEDGVISESSLKCILKDDILSLPLSAPSSTTNSSSSHLLGHLTSLGRDEWYKTRQIMIDQNSESINVIDEAMFVLGLDVEASPDDDDFVSVALHGGHRSGTQEHRWYDKTCLIVDPNGRAAYNFEHSMYDGAAMRRLCDELYLISSNKPTGREVWDYKWSTSTQKDWSAKRLELNLNNSLKQSIQNAILFHGKNQKKINIIQGTFVDYGKNEMKKLYKTSPDGVLQALYKLVHARIHGWSKNQGIYVYESCQTKAFLCGRTEVIRTTTSESVAFVDYMMENEINGTTVDPETVASLLVASANKHSKLAKLASAANGVDRHLFALFCLAESKQKPLPEIFQDDAWSLSNRSILSTSNLSSEAFHGMGFGPVVNDGYGIAYGINSNALYFGISNFVADEEYDETVKNRSGFGGVSISFDHKKENQVATNSVLFREELFKALREMRDIFHEVQKVK
jgi:hypothetical protein